VPGVQPPGRPRPSGGVADLAFRRGRRRPSAVTAESPGRSRRRRGRRHGEGLKARSIPGFAVGGPRFRPVNCKPPLGQTSWRPISLAVQYGCSPAGCWAIRTTGTPIEPAAGPPPRGPPRRRQQVIPLVAGGTGIPHARDLVGPTGGGRVSYRIPPTTALGPANPDPARRPAGRSWSGSRRSLPTPAAGPRPPAASSRAADAGQFRRSLGRPGRLRAEPAPSLGGLLLQCRSPRWPAQGFEPDRRSPMGSRDLGSGPRIVGIGIVPARGGR
jgi:hypothetical protein